MDSALESKATPISNDRTSASDAPALRDRIKSHASVEPLPEPFPNHCKLGGSPCGTYLNPHSGIGEGFRRAVRVRVIVFLVAILIGSSLGMKYVADQQHMSCLEPEVPWNQRWKPVVVLNLLIFFVAFVIDGANPELCLLLVAALAVFCQCLSPQKVFDGASSGAVTSLALLFPIAKSLADTGVPEKLIGRALGNPRTAGPAIARMFMSVGGVGAVFNNTPIVAMMIPVLLSFAQRLDLDKAALLMPLSFAAQASGNLSLMGSSINFVAQDVFSSAFKLGFFDLTLGGFILMIVGTVYCSFAGPTLLTTSNGEKESDDDDEKVQLCTASQIQAVLREKNLFSVAVVVNGDGPFVGQQVRDCGIHRIKGVFLVSRVFRPAREAACAGYGSMDVEAAVPLDKGSNDKQNYFKIAELWCNVSCITLQAEDVLEIAATAEGVAALRNSGGVELSNEQSELELLGARRRERILMEATITEAFVGETISTRDWRLDRQCGIVGLRNSSDSAGLAQCRLTLDGYKLQQGDVLLLESSKNNVGSDTWAAAFSVVRPIPNSKPPRSGRRADLLRAVTVSLGLVTVIALTILNKPYLKLEVLCIPLLCLLIAIKALTVREAFEAVNGSVLLTIVGALALGAAMQETKLANCFAAGVVSIAKPYGQTAVLVALYLSTWGLGFFVTNAAVVAIMGHIGIPIAVALNIPIARIVLVIVYAASACFMTPYGYQTNLMVMKDGGYTWGSFIRFGGPLQILHLITTILIVPYCANFISPATH